MKSYCGNLWRTTLIRFGWSSRKILIIGDRRRISQYVRILWNLQELPTDHAMYRWNDVGIPEMNKLECNNSFVKAMYAKICTNTHS